MNKKYRQKYIFRFIISSFFLTYIFFGCTKDFLNEIPTGAVSDEIFWRNADDAHGALMGVYSTFYERNAERVQDLDKSLAWMCAFAGYGSWRNFGWSRGDQLNTTSGPPIQLWRNCFRHIAQANNLSSG